MNGRWLLALAVMIGLLSAAVSFAQPNGERLVPDEATRLALGLAASHVAGYLIQRFIRQPAAVKSWWTWPVVGVSAVALYAWATHNVVAQFEADWRLGALQFYQWCLTLRGAVSSSKDVGAAGAQDTK